MQKQDRRPRAIDLYSGVGGWSLGLRLAGVNVVASYEVWGAANETNFKNNSHQAQTIDIRRLALEDLPKDIDIVVGSPPCTQFSYSNRGGGGDLEDGLKDIKQFLSIVDHLKPRLWAMENVPRVARIIEKELQPGGTLASFAHLGCVAHIVDMADYGLPQRRRRCIAGNFDPTVLESFKDETLAPTLGDVVAALNSETIIDPIYGLQIERTDLIDHVEEDWLSEEEVRINRANKVTHTVYNSMPFPDPLERTVRTITATCTRVSRESVVISAPGSEALYRRLTLRERACLQGFPITFQFYGANYGQKLRMIGNALPPAFSFVMGRVLRGARAEASPTLREASRKLKRPKPIPPETPPDRVGSRYSSNRTFKFAIPSLQMKSGVRFELANDSSGVIVIWKMAFYFGTSKEIHSIALDDSLKMVAEAAKGSELLNLAKPHIDKLRCIIEAADIRNMQTVWAHKGPGGMRPFMLLDILDDFGSKLKMAIAGSNVPVVEIVERVIQRQYGEAASTLPGLGKLLRNADTVLAGLLIASVVNPILMANARSNQGKISNAIG